MRITQTGAFYFKVVPTRADILIDENLVKRTDFLFGSALTKNFFPGNYFVEIAKEGYHSWQKILEVKERQVEEAKYVLLFKKETMFQQLADAIVDFWISPDQRYALLLEQKDGLPWELTLLNLQTLGKEPLVEQSKDEILNVSWAQDSKHFLIERERTGLIIREVHDITSSQPCSKEPCSLEYLGQNIENIQFSPAASGQVLFTKFLNETQVLFSAEYLKKEAALPIANNVLSFITHGNSVTWLANDGNLWQQDLTSKSEAQKFQASLFVPKGESSYVLFIAGDSILLKEDASLFLHERGSSIRREILSPVSEIKVASGGTRVAIKNQSELWVLFLKEETEQPQRQASDLILLTRFSMPIDELLWVGSNYLLFSLGGNIRVSEIDNRDRLNIADIAEFSSPKLYFDNEKGTLYVLSGGAFSVSERLR